ncbi:MAG: type 4a pilus biogenesis protein PilO [Endomicrobiia bacterium]
MKKQQQTLIGIIVAFGIFVLFYFRVLLLPLNKKISEKIRLIGEKNKKLQEAILLQESLPLLQQQTEALKIQVADLEKKLPNKPDIPELIKIISRVSSYYNIKISNITTKEMDTSAKDYNEIPFSISFTTNYHNLAQFLASIAQEKRIFAARDLVLTYSAGSSAGSKDNYLNISGVIFSYVLK